MAHHPPRTTSRTVPVATGNGSKGHAWEERGEIVVPTKMEVPLTEMDGDASTVGRAEVALIASLDAMVEELYRALEYTPTIAQPLMPGSNKNKDYEWVWAANIPLQSWLKDSSSFFWISGKPGTGKSTLIKYLSKSKTTRECLSRNNAPFKLVRFSLDFTSELSSGKDVQGLMKMFLAQLCVNFRDVECRMATLNDKHPFTDATEQELVEIFCDEVSEMECHLCALIDGLDAYDGDDDDLVETLITLQRRTTMKLLVACTPSKTAFTNAFQKSPQIDMQRNNASNVRSFLDQAIDDARSQEPFINSILVDPIRRSIVERSQGVMIWSQLVVDEMIRHARQGATTARMQSILEHLPQDLDEMYTLTIQRKTRDQQVETAFFLKFISVLQIYGQAPLRVLRGFWLYFYPLLPVEAPPTIADEDSTFEPHFTSLLGSLVDINPSDQTIRLTHSTLTTFLNKSSLVSSLLPTRFQNTRTKDMFMSICTSIIRDATICQGSDTSSITRKIIKQEYAYNRINSAYEPSLTGLESPQDEQWQAQSAALEYCLLSVGQEICSYTSQQSTLGCHYITSWKSPLNLCLKPSATRLKKHELRQLLAQDINDILTAIRFGSVEYLGSKMSVFKQLAAHHKDVVFRYALEWTPRSGGFHSNWKVCRLLAPYVDVLTTPMLDLLIYLNNMHIEEQEDDDCPDPQPDSGLTHVLAILGTDCEERFCGISGIDGPKFSSLLHWWYETCRESSIALDLLGAIIRFQPDLNSDFAGQGTALFKTMSRCNEEHTLVDCPLKTFMLFAALGADPEVTHNGEPKVLDLAESMADVPESVEPKVADSPKRSKWKKFLPSETPETKAEPVRPRRVKAHPGHDCDAESAIELLQHYRKHKTWPNLWQSNLFGVAAREMAWANYAPSKGT